MSRPIVGGLVTEERVVNLRVANVGLLCGVLAASVACSTTLDMKVIEASVTSGIESQMSLPVASVACPSETKTAKAGDTFECVVTPKDGIRPQPC